MIDAGTLHLADEADIAALRHKLARHAIRVVELPGVGHVDECPACAPLRDGPTRKELERMYSLQAATAAALAASERRLVDAGALHLADEADVAALQRKLAASEAGAQALRAALSALMEATNSAIHGQAGDLMCICPDDGCIVMDIERARALASTAGQPQR